MQSRKGKAAVLARIASTEAAKAPLLRDFWEVYLRGCRANRLKPSTLDTKATLARLWLRPMLGDKDLRQCCDEQSIEQLKLATSELGHARANAAQILLLALLRTAAKSYGVKAANDERKDSLDPNAGPVRLDQGFGLRF